MIKTRSIAAVAIAASALFATACGSDKESTPVTEAPIPSPAPRPTMAPAEAGDIVAVASGNPDFSTLVTAVAAAGLVETLEGAGPFTVFAPTNEAFAALPAGLLEKLLLPENKEALTAILTYHVLGSEVMAADVAAGDVATVQGENITITTEGGVKVNEANVTATDVMASNGVIHVIDAVLVPPTLDLSAL